jgi:hypothetical protein
MLVVAAWHMLTITHTHMFVIMYIYHKQAAKEVAEFLGTVHHSYQYTIQVRTCYYTL